MLDLNQETFIAQYVTTFLATRAAFPEAGKKIEPGKAYDSLIEEAIMSARQSWCNLLAANAMVPRIRRW